MIKTTVAVGIEPAFAEFTQFPNLTPELIRHSDEVEIQRLREVGYDAEAV